MEIVTEMQIFRIPVSADIGGQEEGKEEGKEEGQTSPTGEG